MNGLIEVLVFAVLIAPALWEQNDDKNGDLNKASDVYVRAALVLLAAFFNYMLRDFNFMRISSFMQIVTGMLRPALMSVALFFLTFDYWINWRLGHKEMLSNDGRQWGWLEYTGKAYYNADNTRMSQEQLAYKNYNWWDRQAWWLRIGWKGRLAVKLVFFIAAAWYYF